MSSLQTTVGTGQSSREQGIGAGVACDISTAAAPGWPSQHVEDASPRLRGYGREKRLVRPAAEASDLPARAPKRRRKRPGEAGGGEKLSPVNTSRSVLKRRNTDASSTGEEARAKDEYKVQLVDADLPDETFEQSELTPYDDSIQDYIQDADGNNYSLDDGSFSGSQPDTASGDHHQSWSASTSYSCDQSFQRLRD